MVEISLFSVIRKVLGVKGECGVAIFRREKFDG